MHALALVPEPGMEQVSVASSSALVTRLAEKLHMHVAVHLCYIYKENTLSSFTYVLHNYLKYLLCIYNKSGRRQGVSINRTKSIHN